MPSGPLFWHDLCSRGWGPRTCHVFFQDMPIDIETYQFTTFINISTFLHLDPLSVEFVNFLKLKIVEF